MKVSAFLFLWLMTLSSFGQVQLQLANQAMEDGNYAEALGYWEKVYKNIPGQREGAYRRMVDCYIALEKYDDATDFIGDHRAAANTRSDVYYIDEGYVLWIDSDTVEAKQNFQKVFDAVARMPAMAYQYSERFKEWGLFRFALQTLEISEANNPQMFFAQQKALLYAEMGQLENMYGAYLDVMERNPNFLNTYQNILRYNMNRDGEIPQSEDLRRLTIQKIQEGGNIAFNQLLIWIFTQEGNYSAAFRQEKALYLRGEGRPFDILQLGASATQTGDYQNAEQIYQFLIDEGRNTPFYADAVFGLSRARLSELISGNPEMDEVAQVREDMIEREGLLSGNSLQAEALLMRAELEYLYLQKPDSALATIDQLLALSPPHSPLAAEGKLLKGDIELSSGAPYDAILTYAQVEGYFESGPLGQEARFRRARVAFYTGDFEWAEATFKVLKTSTSKLIANDAMRLSLLIKDNAALDTTYIKLEHYARILLLQTQRKYDEALLSLDTLENILSLSSEHPLDDEIIYTRARIFEDRELWDTAVVSYLEVANAFPKELLADEALIRAARIAKEKLRNTDLASELFERILLEHGNSIYAEEARNEFRKLRGDLNT